MRNRSLSSTALVIGGGLLASVGLYFAFLRPALLPEDLRSMGTSMAFIEANIPGLLVWLRRVFVVMGGYMFAAGVLTVHVATASFRGRARNAFVVVAIAGISSIGVMVSVNFLIGSDVRWLLLGLSLPWVLALVLYRSERRHKLDADVSRSGPSSRHE